LVLFNLIVYILSIGDTCAAKFVDGSWYRAKIEKVSGNKVSVFYIDYGNKQEIQSVDCAALPGGFVGDKAFAHNYSLACVSLPNDVRSRPGFKR
jgi:staphylococcal nuclease domain-containing protein 1